MDKKLILIAEDEVAYGKILKTILEKEGYDVVIALNGDELLKIAGGKKAALVILDLIMPVKDGFLALSEMKKNTQLKTIPVIALSNLGQDEDIAKAKRLGADGFIIKSDEAFYDVIHKIKRMVN